MEIEVRVKKVYGHERFYPINEDSKIICELMNTKTFTKDQLIFCKDSGWSVSVKTEEYEF